MLVEDVYEQIRAQTYIPITLDELNNTPQACLQAFDQLLLHNEASRVTAAAKETEDQAKLAHLSKSISHLADQNSILQTRLLASLDALSASSNSAVDTLREENDALRLLNGNLALRLQDAHYKQAEMQDTILSITEPVRAINNESAMLKARAVANEYIQAMNIVPDTQHDDDEEDDGISDAGIEMQVNYQASPSNYYANAEAGLSTKGALSSRPELRLRTRTILLELANELEASRRDVAALQVERQQSTSMLQSQIDSRNKELATLYSQLDRFFGLPGFPLTKSGKNKPTASQEHPATATVNEEELAKTLRLQLQVLKEDIHRLTVEKENIARYGPGRPWTGSSFATSEAPYIDEMNARIIEQEASFEKVARRAREKLVEQESMIESLKSELSKAQNSLQSMHGLEEEDVFSTRHDARHLSVDSRAALGESIQRPRSAFADPHAGSNLFVNGMPRLDGPWQREA